jgi:hypothetical protein
MLGYLEMSVDECISAYLTISRSIFTRTRRFPISLGVRNGVGEVRGVFDSEGLASAVKAMLRERGFHEEALLYDRSRPGQCKM